MLDKELERAQSSLLKAKIYSSYDISVPVMATKEKLGDASKKIIPGQYTLRPSGIILDISDNGYNPVLEVIENEQKVVCFENQFHVNRIINALYRRYNALYK